MTDATARIGERRTPWGRQRAAILLVIASLPMFTGCSDVREAGKPNIVLCMADDLGWGDVGYNGNSWIETPSLDRMAREGLRLDHFYSASAVCSPTRASVLTGRSPQRMGIYGASRGYLKQEEITLAEALKSHGYATGFFGKWHLGTLTTSVPDGRRSRRASDFYSPPWLHGFDESFATESAVPTWDPMDMAPLEAVRRNPQIPTRYWIAEDTFATENLEGDDSRVIMDRVIPFIEKHARARTPFLAVVWFHAPHEPVVAGPKYRKQYEGRASEADANYGGAITAMDEQIGRLRRELARLGIEHNTMLFFTSDNGPRRGSAGPFRGGKGSLLEGGLRVPGLLVWPDKVREPRTIDMASHTDDLYPTVLDAVGIRMEEQPRPLDGISLMPMIEGADTRRGKPMAFELAKQLAYIEGSFKIYSSDGGESFALYNLDDDLAESSDLSRQRPDRLQDMIAALDAWRASCAESMAGADYR